MKRRGLQLAGWAAAAAACLVAGLAAELSAEKTSKKTSKKTAAKVEAGEAAGGLKLVYPPDKAVVPSGNFDVICLGEAASLRADGELIPWEAFEPPLKVAHVSLYCGPNMLEIGGKRTRVFVAETATEPGGPDDWPLVRGHPIRGAAEDRCADCHAVESRVDGVAVGEPLGYKACFKCHKAVEFEAIHSHPLEPIEHCEMCHGVHGSTEKKLLKAPVKKLCDECHES